MFCYYVLEIVHDEYDTGCNRYYKAGDKWCNKIIIASNINVWIHTNLMVQTNFSFSFIGIASWLELVKFWVTGAFDVHRQVKVFTYPKSELKWSVFLYTHDTNGAHLGATRSPNQNSWASLSSSFTTLYRSSEGSSIGGIWLLNAIKDVAERLHPDVSSWTGSNVQNAIFPYHSAPWDRDFHHSLRKCTGYTKKLDLSSMPKTVISRVRRTDLSFPALIYICVGPWMVCVGTHHKAPFRV